MPVVESSMVTKLPGLKPAVMGNCQQCTGIFIQSILQHFFVVYVQVVGRLVQYQKLASASSSLASASLVASPPLMCFTCRKASSPEKEASRVLDLSLVQKGRTLQISSAALFQVEVNPLLAEIGYFHMVPDLPGSPLAVATADNLQQCEVLPQPLGPINATRSPPFNRKEMFLNKGRPLNSMVKLRHSRTWRPLGALAEFESSFYMFPGGGAMRPGFSSSRRLLWACRVFCPAILRAINSSLFLIYSCWAMYSLYCFSRRLFRSLAVKAVTAAHNAPAFFR